LNSFFQLQTLRRLPFEANRVQGESFSRILISGKIIEKRSQKSAVIDRGKLFRGHRTIKEEYKEVRRVRKKPA